MKINILSDLHLNHQGLPWPDNDADVVVLAGDIARPTQAVDWARRIDRPVIYVPGNHEFYGGSLAARLDELRALCSGTQIRLLDCSETVIDGVRFVGATLWTDLELFGASAQRDEAIDAAKRCLRDFSRIYTDAAHTTFMTPADSAAMHATQLAWLAARIATPPARFNGPTVVVTHHAPSPRSIHPRFAGSLLNLCFVSDLERMLDGNRVRLWIHGHTHDSFDYAVNGTRVVCNPRGYAVDGINENDLFDSNFIVNIDAGSPALRATAGRAVPAAP